MSRALAFNELPADWPARQTRTQGLGDEWLDTAAETLLFVPSVVMPLARAPERNVLINHQSAGAASIDLEEVTPFTLDPRLFRP